MILNQRLLGLPNRLFNGVQLLGDLEAGPAGLDHLDDAAQMAVGTIEPFDDVGVTRACLAHAQEPIPPERIYK